jgi:transposase
MRAFDPEVVDVIWRTVEPLLPQQVETNPLGCPRPRVLAGSASGDPDPAGDRRVVVLELRGPGRLLGRVAVPRVRDAVAANLGSSRNCWRVACRGTLGAQSGGIDRSPAGSPASE